MILDDLTYSSLLSRTILKLKSQPSLATWASERALAVKAEFEAALIQHIAKKPFTHADYKAIRALYLKSHEEWVQLEKLDRTLNEVCEIKKNQT